MAHEPGEGLMAFVFKPIPGNMFEEIVWRGQIKTILAVAPSRAGGFGTYSWE
jgi:hypothetical protein